MIRDPWKNDRGSERRPGPRRRHRWDKRRAASTAPCGPIDFLAARRCECHAVQASDRSAVRGAEREDGVHVCQAAVGAIPCHVTDRGSARIAVARKGHVDRSRPPAEHAGCADVGALEGRRVILVVEPSWWLRGRSTASDRTRPTAGSGTAQALRLFAQQAILLLRCTDSTLARVRDWHDWLHVFRGEARRARARRGRRRAWDRGGAGAAGVCRRSSCGRRASGSAGGVACGWRSRRAACGG